MQQDKQKKTAASHETGAKTTADQQGGQQKDKAKSSSKAGQPTKSHKSSADAQQKSAR
jgi:hypothetical protein